MENQTK